MSGVVAHTQHHYKTWTEAAGQPEISAQLERLPEDLEFTEDFPEPIRFDPKRQRLVYRGFMTSVSYRFLHALSPDSEYSEAIDYLFQASSYAMEPRSGIARAWPWLLGASLLAAGTFLIWMR